MLGAGARAVFDAPWRSSFAETRPGTPDESDVHLGPRTCKLDFDEVQQVVGEWPRDARELLLQKPAGVREGGTPLLEKSDLAALEAAQGPGFAWDAAATGGTLYVRVLQGEHRLDVTR